MQTVKAKNILCAIALFEVLIWVMVFGDYFIIGICYPLVFTAIMAALEGDIKL